MLITFFIPLKRLPKQFDLDIKYFRNKPILQSSHSIERIGRMSGNPYLTIENASDPILYFQARGVTYDEAVQSCRTNYNGKIADLKDPDLFKRISAVMPTAYSQYYRIGLKKSIGEEVFRYEDGSFFENGALEMPALTKAMSEDCLAMSVYKVSGSGAFLRPVECSRALAYICQSDGRSEGLENNEGDQRTLLIAAIITAAVFCLILLLVFVAVGMLLVRKRSASSNTRSEDRGTKKENKLDLSESKYAEVWLQDEQGKEILGNSSAQTTRDDLVTNSPCVNINSVYSMANEPFDVSALYSVVNKKLKPEKLKGDSCTRNNSK